MNFKQIIFLFLLITFSKSNFYALDVKKIDSLKDEFITLSQQKGNKDKEKKKCKILRKIAFCYLQDDNWKKALQYDRQAYQIASKLKNHYLMSNILIDIGNDHLAANQFDYAIKSNLLCLRILKKNQHSLSNKEYFETAGISYMNCGAIYSETRNYSLALSNLRQATAIFNKYKPDDFHVKINILNTGAVLNELGDHKEALTYLKKSIDGVTLINQHFVAIANGNLGKSYHNLQDYGTALNYYKKSLHFYEESGLYISEKAEIHSKLAASYLKINKLKEANNHLMIALKLLDKSNRYEDRVYDVLTDYYILMGDHKNVVKYLKMQREFEKHKFNPKTLSNIAHYQSEFETFNNKLKDQLEIQALERKQEIKTFRMYSFAGISVIIILLLLLFFFRQKHRTRLQEIKLEQIKTEQGLIQEKLNFKNSQLNNFAVYILSKHELLEAIKSKLDLIKTKFKQDEDVTNLTNFINQQIDFSKEHTNFEVEVSDVNQDFYYKLESKFPQLTNKDKKLCSLILLDLTNKEIASLTGISIDGVEKSRNRLRKKLNLSSTTDLNRFFSNI